MMPSKIRALYRQIHHSIHAPIILHVARSYIALHVRYARKWNLLMLVCAITMPWRFHDTVGRVCVVKQLRFWLFKVDCEFKHCDLHVLRIGHTCVIYTLRSNNCELREKSQFAIFKLRNWNPAYGKVNCTIDVGFAPLYILSCHIR